MISEKERKRFGVLIEKLWNEKIFLALTCLVLFVVFLPRAYSLSFSILMALASILLFLQSPKSCTLKYFAVTSLLVILALLSFPVDLNNEMLLVESKLLMTPLLMAFFTSFPVRYQDPGKNLQWLVWLIVIANIGALFYTSFSFRYIDQIGVASVSIYMGILLAVCALLVKSKIIFFVICFLVWMSGSGTALLSLFAAIYFRLFSRKINSFRNEFSVVLFFLYMLIAIGICVFLFLILMDIRGRSLDDLHNIDRIQFLCAGIVFALENFSVLDFLFGYGIRKIPVEIYHYFPINSSLIDWIADGRGYDNFSALLFHNEFLRIFYNFGIVGLTSVLYLFWSFCGKKNGLSVFCIVMVGSFFSSTLYITPLIVPLFYIIRLWRLENLKQGLRG